MSLGRGIIAAGAAGSANFELRTGTRADRRVATRPSSPRSVSPSPKHTERAKGPTSARALRRLVWSYAIPRCDHSRRRMNGLTIATQAGRAGLSSAQIVMTNSGTPTLTSSLCSLMSRHRVGQGRIEVRFADHREDAVAAKDVND